MNYSRQKSVILIITLLFIVSSISFGKIDPRVFSEFKPRSIGPANISGRIADIDVVLSDTDIIYVGSATGGVWKSENNGISWQPVFDDQSTSSIGAVKIFQKNPNIVWVGTGEANPRNSCGVGRGVFKSIDGGKTWTCVGLEKTEKISRILLHPDDPNIAYAAAMGTTWGENPERGVFKTGDGGKTWKKVLYVDEKTGAADLVMAPGNPNKLIAAMWQHRRWPWFFKSGGPGSGIYMTGDGGDNWKKLTPKDGLPPGELGRCGLAFATNKSDIVYALIEAKDNALYRSADGGFKWRRVHSKPGIGGRPFYYADIRVNPVNENIIYSLESRLLVSEDGGKNLRSLASFFKVHPDYHAMWNHPNGDYIIVGNDGGIAFTRDRGKNWRFAANLPLAQFYHISYDMDLPYHVYGGLQDNGSWRGSNTVYKDFSIYDYYWKLVGFGDGFDTEPDPEDSHFGYSMSQGGYLMYFDVRTGRTISIRPTESEVKHRYNWNAGLAIDPFEPATIYYGSQFVHRSKDKGRTWEIISPDLTTNDPEKQKQSQSGGLTLDVTAAENHTTILCIAPSPVKKGTIWAGTDDGHVQLTQDGGKTWELVSRKLTGTKKTKKSPVPYGTWVPHVEASKFDAASAFVVFDDHRRANRQPYIFATQDYGKTWKSLVTAVIDGFVHVIEQDHKNKDLLFIGTEFGMYVSFNGGREWMKWTQGLPTVPVRDLVVHPRDNDLIIGTHGRGAYILDDISPFREINEDILKKELHLFPVSQAYQYRTAMASSYLSPGDGVFRGQNRKFGALLTYVYNPPEQEKDKEKKPGKGKKGNKDKKNKPKDKPKLKIEVLNPKGEVIRRVRPSTKKGINRISWDLKTKAHKYPEKQEKEDPGYDYPGPFVVPGEYKVRLTYGDAAVSQPVTVHFDPRYDVDLEVIKKNFDLSKKIGGWFNSLADAYAKISKMRKTISTLKGLMKDFESDKKGEIMKSAGELEKKLKALADKITPDYDRKGIDDTAEVVEYELYYPYSDISDSFEPPTQAALVKLEKSKKMVQKVLEETDTLFETDVKAFVELVKKSGFSIFTPYKPLEPIE